MVSLSLAGFANASQWRAAASGRRARATRGILAGRRLAQGLAVLLLLMQTPSALAAPASPSLAAGVVDEADILPADAIADITVKLKALEDRTSDHAIVATVKSLQGDNIDDYAHELGRAWGVGGINKKNVVILLVAPNERKVRIEVYGVGTSLTDALSQTIIDDTILPRFRANDMAGGIEAGVDAIVAALSGNGETDQEKPGHIAQ
jgi:uncharacterized protein